MAFSNPIIDLVEGETPWVTYMKALLYEKNSCVNALVVGPQGSGKSWATLRLCCELDPDFKLEGSWFFKLSDMVKSIDQYYRKNTSKQQRIGKIWVLDEAGIDLYNLKFRDVLNTVMNHFVQTARYKNYYMFLTVPHIGLISANVRTLLNTIINVEGYNAHKQTKLRARLLDYNPYQKQFYQKRLYVKTDSGLIRCQNFLVYPPKKRYRIEYEKRKEAFNENLSIKLVQMVEEYDESERKKKQAKLTPNQDMIRGLLYKGEDVKTISMRLNMPQHQVRKNCESMIQKGIPLTPVKQRGKITKYKIGELYLRENFDEADKIDDL